MNTNIECLFKDKTNTEKMIIVFKKLANFDLYKKRSNCFNENLNFFINSFEYLEVNERSLQYISQIFLSKISFDINKLDKINYILFFEKNNNFLKPFYNYLNNAFEKNNTILKDVLDFTNELLIIIQIKNF